MTCSMSSNIWVPRFSNLLLYLHAFLMDTPSFAERSRYEIYDIDLSINGTIRGHMNWIRDIMNVHCIDSIDRT
jgi:hypothetical protein